VLYSGAGKGKARDPILTCAALSVEGDFPHAFTERSGSSSSGSTRSTRRVSAAGFAGGALPAKVACGSSARRRGRRRRGRAMARGGVVEGVGGLWGDRRNLRNSRDQRNSRDLRDRRS